MTERVGFKHRKGAPCPHHETYSTPRRPRSRELAPRDVAAHLEDYAVLDVREPDEYEQGALPGAVHVPRGQLEFSVEGRLTDKDVPVAVYCAGGTRSVFAAKTLQDLGYNDVVSIAGGFNRWKDEGLAWTTPATLTRGPAPSLPAPPAAARGRRVGPAHPP